MSTTHEEEVGAGQTIRMPLFRHVMLLVIVTSMLAGCLAHVGAPFLRRPATQEDVGVVYLYRPAKMGASVQSPMLYVDGVRKIAILNGGYARMELSPGEHFLYVQTLTHLNYGKGEIVVDAGREYFFRYDIEPPDLRFKAAFMEMFMSGRDISAADAVSVGLLPAAAMVAVGNLIFKNYKPDAHEPLVLVPMPEEAALKEINETKLIEDLPVVNPSHLAIGKLNRGEHREAWNMISEELANPTVSSKIALCELHVAVLQILGQIVNSDFAPADADQMAKSSYEYVMESCKEDKKRSYLAENLYGVFFHNTKRPGLAILHFTRALELSDEGSYEKMVNEHNLGNTYAAMGQYELRDSHRLGAIRAGKEHFSKPRTYRNDKDEGAAWLQYMNIFQYRLDDLSGPQGRVGVIGEMQEIWKEIEAINEKWVSTSTKFTAYTHASGRFALAGDIPFARKLLHEAKILTEKFPHQNPQVPLKHLQSAEAQIMKAESKRKEASDLSK